MKPWARLAFVAASVVFAVEGGCSSQLECQLEDSHCEGATALQCESYEVSTGSASRLVRVRCPSADTCKTDAYGAFCTLDAQPDPSCGPGEYCDGQTKVRCRSGHRVEWTTCNACTPSAGGIACNGGIGYGGCGGGNACVPGLDCGTDKRCVSSCDCPAGEDCATCAAFGVTAGYRWVCQDQLCTLIRATQ